MNEQAFEDAFRLFVENGYADGPEDFRKLISENPEALNDSYKLFKANGYADGIDDFKSLIGVEAPKQEEPGFFAGLFGSDKESANTVSNTMMGKVGAYEPEVKKKAVSMASPSGESSSALPSKPKDAITSKQDFNTSMKEVNPSLIAKDEEIAVPHLQNMFGDYGFKFEEAGPGYDAVKVTAPNGKTLEVSIDRFTDNGDVESSNQIKSFIDANKPKIDNEVSQYDKYYKRYRNQKEVDDAYKTINQETTSIQSEKNKLAADIVKSKAEEDELKRNPDAARVQALTQKKQEIASRTATLAEMQKANQNNHARLEEAVGKYTRNTANQGTWYGLTANTLLEGGYGAVTSLMDVGAYVQSKANALVNATDLALRGDMSLSDAWKVSNAVGNVQKEEVTKGIEEGKKALKENVEFDVSDAYKKAAQENFFARNALGIVNFLPAIGASMINPTAGYTAFFASGYDGAMEEMKNNPAFEKLGTDEKVGVAAALGIANAAIMKYSPTNKYLESAAGKELVGNILTKMGSETAAKSVQEFADNEVKSAVNRGLISTAGNLAHGFATGVELKLSSDAVKGAYDVVKGKEMFQFPDNAADYVKQIAESGLDMAVGSAMMGGIKSISTAYKDNNFNGVNDAVIDNYKTFTNEDMQKAYEESLNIKVANGDMTEAQKNKELNDMNMGVNVLSKIPDEYSAAQKRKAFSLIREREILEQSIEGKDKSLVKAQTERITEINKDLEDVSKMPRAEAPAPAVATPVAPEAQPAKPKTLDEIEDESVKEFLNSQKNGFEDDLKLDEQDYNKAKENFDSKNPIVRFFSKKPSYEQYTQYTKNKLELLNNNPEQYIKDEIKKYEKYKEEEGEEFDAQDYLDYLKEQQSKLQEENAIQKPTTEESVLRTEQPEVELPTMGEGNAKGKAAQEGIAPAKPQEVKPTQAKPIEQELAELEQMFPTEGPTGENKGVAASDTKAMEEIASRSTDERVQKVVRTAQKLTKTLKSLFPNAEINIHETEDSYNGAMEENKGRKGSNGNFAFGVVDGKPFVRIDINANTATSSTVAHEVAHAVLVKTFGDNQKLFQSFQEKIAKVISTDSNQKLLDFANNPKYREQGVTYEEYMAELKAILSEEGSKIELSTAKKIAAVINEYVSKITKGAFKPFQEVTDVKQVVDFVNKVTEAMAKGEAIDVEAAGKMGEGSRSSLREGALKDVESTTKALEPIVNEKKSSIGVQLRKLVGLIAHNGSESITKFDPTKIKGQTRGRYGKGFYFSSLFKNFDYGDKSTFLNSKKLNLLNGDMYVSDVIYKLSSPTEINARINKFKELLSKSKNNREYNEILEEINILEEERSSFDENSKYIERALEKAVQEKPKEQFSSFLENLESRVIESNRLNPSRAVQGLDESLNKLLLKSGFDGVSFTEGHEMLIIPQEKLNDLIISSQEKAISEAYHKAKEDGSNPKLVKAVEDLLGAGEITSRSSLRTAEQVDKMVKDARASGYSEKAIEEFLKKRGVDQAIVDKSLGKKEAGTKIVTNEEMMPGYDKVMEDVNSKILRGLDRKTKETTIEKNVMKIVEGSEAYKNATDQQRNQMVRDVKEAFGEKMKQAPSAEKITGKEQKEKTVTITEKQALKDQIKLEAKAAKEGASSVKTAIKKIRDFVVNNKEVANLTRRDLLKVIDIMKSVNDEKSLEKATNKVLDIIDKANKDIIEVSKTKMDAAKMKAELKAAKDSAKGVVNKIKAVKAYFDSVQEYGNLTRKDLRRIMKEMASVKDEASLDKAVNNINDIIDKATSDKIEISEKKMIANTIKEVKLAKGNIKEKRKLITDVIDSIKKSGKLTAAQVNALLKRANNLNVESFEHLNKFIDYAEKIFADADYQNKLSKANAERTSIRKSSKNKGNKYDANLVRLAKRFLTIDPSLVENIDEYNKMASDIAEAIKGSSTKAFKPTVDIKVADAYIEETMKAQKEKLTEMMREQVEELLGVDGSTLTYDEMIKMMESEKKDMSEQKEKIIRSAAIKLFESLSSNIEYILEKGKDPFTGEPVDIKESKKNIVKRFMDMDLTKMDIKDAIAAVDALNNFIVNQSTAKMDDVVSKYEGRDNSKIVKAANIISKPLRLYFSKGIGRGMTQQFVNLPMVFERLFKSPAVGAYVQKMMGVTDLINNKSRAAAISKKAVNDYFEKFYKGDRKVNGEKFNSSFNDIERGVLADMLRTIAGTPDQVQAEFERKKGLLEQSIEKLKKGDDTQKKKADIYQKVYDKIVKDSNSFDEVKAKADATNVEAVDYWVKEWSNHYDDLADVSENVYNRILDKDLNYTPVRMSKIEEDNSLESEESAFHSNNGTIFKKKTGSLMEATRPDELPENRYVDYSFDSKMSNSLHDALVDIYTAADIRKVEAFIKSDSFKDIFPNVEDRRMLEGRIQLMVRNFRNKNHYDYDELSKSMKYVNKLGNVGVAAALGGFFQPIKQTIPVAVNTLVNAGDLSFRRFYDKENIDNFLDNSGYGIAVRGKESTSDVKAIDTMIEDVATNAASKGAEWTTNKLKKLQEYYLKKALVEPDVAIARMSWITYYEKSLKEQGKDVKNIDYSDHELNKEAADYAQKMVDRQQNISDSDLKGKFFSNKDATSQLISKVLFPFASFRMNQSARLASDFIALTSKTTSLEDKRKAARSLGAASLEIATFNAIGGFAASLLYSGVKSLMANDNEDEEDKKKREEADQKYIDLLKKGRATSAIQDFLSPMPATDWALQYGLYNTIDAFNGEEKKGKEDEQFNILKPKGREGFQALGVLGIMGARAYDLMQITKMAKTGTFEDDYGNTKNIRSKDKSVFKTLIPLAVLNSAGALPTEFYTAQNIILKDIKKQASTQTEAEIIQEKAKKREKRADNIEKIQVINRAINTATDQAVVNELMKMRKETRDELFPQKMSDEAKEVMKRKREREKASYKGLLGGYDTKTDLKRYNPDLYEQNFGENSEYGQTHKAEVKADKLFDAMMKKTKDEKYGYQAPAKKKSHKRKKNSDGSYKKSYFRYSSR